MLVRNRMSRRVVSTTAVRPLAEVRATLYQRRIRQMPVVAGAKVIGIITDRDLRSAGAKAKVVADVMQRKVLTADPSMSVDEAARLLSQHKINALPVVERDCIAGIITTSDILAAFVDLCGVTEPTYRVSVMASGRLGEHEVRRVLEQHRCELKWLHAERKPRSIRIHLRLKTQQIDDITTALEATGFTVAAVVTSRPMSNKVDRMRKVTKEKRKAS